MESKWNEQTEFGKGDKSRKLDISIFEGMLWGEYKKNFLLRGKSEEENLEAVMVALDGDVLSWFQQ